MDGSVSKVFEICVRVKRRPWCLVVGKPTGKTHLLTAHVLFRTEFRFLRHVSTNRKRTPIVVFFVDCLLHDFDSNVFSVQH